jgi:hypothetical protein
MPLEHDRFGWHLNYETTKSWKQLEQSLRRIGAHAKDWFYKGSPNVPFFVLIEPEVPSKFGYFIAHTTEDAAQSGLRSSLDAFVIYSAYLSFLAALCRFIGLSERFPSWLPKMEPQLLTAFMSSHIVDFSGERKRTGTVIDVLKCGWTSVAKVLLQAKVPIWLYWGDRPLMVTPRVGWMADHRPQLVDLLPPVQNLFSSLPPAPLPSQPQSSASGVLSRPRHPTEQLPDETPKQYFIRRQKRNEERMKSETAQDRQTRANREKASAGRQCPGRKGPAVYRWESDDNGFRVRKLQTRKQVEDVWREFSSQQKVFDSFRNEWDCCTIFGDDDPSDDDDDDDFLTSKAPILTASNVIPQIPIASTSVLPLPHEESMSMDLDAQFVSYRPPVSTASVIPQSAIASTSAQPPVYEESMSSNILPDGTPMDLDTQLLAYPTRNSAAISPPRHSATVNLAPSYHNHPRVSPSHDNHYYDRSRDSRPLGHQRNRRRESPERYVSRRRRSRDGSPQRYVSHRRLSRDDSPRRLRRRDPRDDSPRRPCHDLQDGGRSSLPRSHSREPYQSTPNDTVRVTSHPSPDTVTFHLPPGTVTSHPLPDTRILSESVEKYVYHRFGFHLDENPYTGVPLSVLCTVKFRNWVDVIRSIGCQQLTSSLMHCEPIKEFFECLLSSNDPLRDVPEKFWDLNTRNSGCLNLATGLVHIEPKTFLDGKTLYLIHPVDASRDTWILAVDATTALECVRRRLGPHTTDIAGFLITQGMPFSTLRRMTSIPGPRTPPRPISSFLGTRPINYRFSLTDFSAYQAICESVLKSKPFCRAALCMGGIVARLAREIIPISAALLGPSPDALEGSQEIMVSGSELFCDDKFSETYTDLICGVYEIPTAHRSMYTFKSLQDLTNFNRSSFKDVLVPEAQCLGTIRI